MPHTRSWWLPALLVWSIVIAMLSLRATDIWQGGLPGNDDMMRLQQVRDLIAGQGWYDVMQHRFDTPAGGNMHWSRIPDVFMAGIILLSEPVIGTANAEFLAMLLWPLTLLSLVMASLAVILRRLGASPVGAAAALVMFMLSTSIYQFWPGRIDHHGLGVTLVMIGLAAVLTPERPRISALLAALVVAMMLSVAIESLPYAAALVTAMGLVWIVRGEGERLRLMIFGGGLAGFALLAFLLDAPGPFLAARHACDAFGTGHVVALLTGGTLLAGLALMTAGLAGWKQRLAAGLGAGGLTVAAVLLTSPQCLGSPFAELSSTVQTQWLSTVGEARSALITWQEDPARIVTYYGFILAGLGSAVWAWRQARPEQRLGWGIVIMLIMLGALTTGWQIRAILFAHIFAAIPVGWVLGELFGRYRQTRSNEALLIFAAMLMLLSPAGWKIAGSRLFEPPARQTMAGTTCRLPDAYEALAALPTGRVMSPIDLGTSILVRTNHTIFAAPYHRNPDAIERSASLFMATPDRAQVMLEEIDADYLLYCRGLNQTKTYARLAPGGLSAALEAGNVPDWLSLAGPADTSEGVVQIYRTQRPDSLRMAGVDR